jgi:hypothetical protein
METTAYVMSVCGYARVRAPQSARGVRIFGTLQHGVCMRRTFMAVLPHPRRSFDARSVFSDAITTHAAQPFVPALRCSHADLEEFAP